MSLHERELRKDILETDVCVVVCTTTISGDPLIQGFKADHVILQEAARLQSAEVFVGMPWAEDATTIHMSGDDEQLPPPQENVQENCFAPYLNRSLFDRSMANRV